MNTMSIFKLFGLLDPSSIELFERFIEIALQSKNPTQFVKSALQQAINTINTEGHSK